MCAVYANANLKSCMVCYMILTDVSANEQSQLLFASESFPSSSLTSHRTKGIFIIPLLRHFTIFGQENAENMYGLLTEQAWSIKDLLYDLKHQKMIFDLAGPSEKSRAGSIAPSCPLG